MFGGAVAVRGNFWPFENYNIVNSAELSRCYSDGQQQADFPVACTADEPFGDGIAPAPEKNAEKDDKFGSNSELMICFVIQESTKLENH